MIATVYLIGCLLSLFIFIIMNKKYKLIEHSKSEIPVFMIIASSYVGVFSLLILWVLIHFDQEDGRLQ